MNWKRIAVCAVAILYAVTLRAESSTPATGTTRVTPMNLPEGRAPAALAAPHFPSKLHALVWRNWELVPVERIARTVSATPEQIRELAASMGLPDQTPIPAAYRERAYITVVRRNWHLLPYPQLLTLLDMDAEEMAFRLREDDFLFVKLGNLKPRCEEVRYSPPDDAARKRAEEIRNFVQKEFGSDLCERQDPMFSFVDELSRLPGDSAAITSTSAGNKLRFIYSYFAPFGDPLLDAKLDPYPDGLLARLAANGVNGVWLHVVLRDLAPGGAEFPEFGHGSETRLANLKALATRARKYGIRVYLYMNEPRAMPLAFFEKHPGMGGVRQGPFQAMCTSDPRVLAWMRNALTHVFREIPDLGGVFSITASENFTHCGSHFQKKECPRCTKRTDAELIAEVNTAIRDGVRAGSKDARVICWDWGWNGHGNAPEIVEALPSDVDLMSVSEWALPINRGGIPLTVGEYSLSAVGPGPRARLHWELAKKRGLGAIAKVQLNNSWELSAVPWLPVLDLVAQHCLNLNKVGGDGLMLSWSLGGYPSPNLLVAQLAAQQPQASVDDLLLEVATGRYGKDAAPAIRRAWAGFSAAFSEFPYHGSVLYNGPQHMGPANLLFEQPTSYSATMVGFPYDDLTAWRGSYPAEVWVAQFEKIQAQWDKALGEMRAAREECDADRRDQFDRDLGLAEAAGIHLSSCASQGSFVMARGRADKDAMLRAIAREASLAKRLHALVRRDSRIGFEASNQYYYTPLDLAEKTLNCEYLRARLTGR